MGVDVLVSTCLSVLLCTSVRLREAMPMLKLCAYKKAAIIFVTCSENVAPDSNGAPPLPEITLEVSPPPGG